MSILMLRATPFSITIPIGIDHELDNWYLTQLLFLLVLKDNKILLLAKQKNNGLRMSRLGSKRSAKGAKEMSEYIEEQYIDTAIQIEYKLITWCMKNLVE